MSAAASWPVCLRLAVGGTPLLLPAALFEQILACSRVAVPAATTAGWQALPTDVDGAFTRVGFAVEASPAWQASWLAVFRRMPENVTGGRRFALLLDESPRVLPPLSSKVDVAEAQTAHALSCVRVGDESLVLPDLNALGAVSLEAAA